MKIDRLIGILSILLQKEMVTAPDLARRFEVSRRTISRDDYLLGKEGVTKDLQRDWNWIRYKIGDKMFAPCVWTKRTGPTTLPSSSGRRRAAFCGNSMRTSSPVIT